MASTPMFKTLSMADAYLSSTLLPTTLKTSTYPFLSLPSKPIKFLHLSSSASPPSWVSLKKKPFSSTLVPLVASTSDWAQQEEENQLQQQGEEDEGEEEFKWENEEREEDGAEARLSDWEGEGEEEQIEGSEGSGGEDGLLEEGGEAVEEGFPELSEDAKLFVGNLPYDVDSEQLAQLFDQAGVVEVAEVIYNRQTDQSRGFGFVTMSTVEEAEKAVEMYHRFDMNGRLLTVNKAAPRGARPERTTTSRPFRIYVGNLPWQVDNARLEQLFSEHGKVLEAKVVYDQETGRSRGFGFVAMSSQTEMDDAIAALDGQSLDGRALRVNVAEERPRRGSF